MIKIIDLLYTRPQLIVLKQMGGGGGGEPQEGGDVICVGPITLGLTSSFSVEDNPARHLLLARVC